MANLNLSQFGENTSVSNADYTFVWDSANAISKKVSRNSWLNSGTLTSDAPVTISQTWGNSGQTFKALVVNAAGTSDANSASGSLLADFQLGGTTKAKIDKLGIITANRIILDQSGSTYQLPANTPVFWTGASFLRSPSAGLFSFENNTQANFFVLAADAANTLALRNGAAAQTFRVYKSYLNAGVDYERLSFSHDGVQFGIGTERAGSGIAQPLRFFGGSSAALDFANGVSFRNASGGTTFMTVASSGNVGIGTTAPGAKLDIGNGGDLVTDYTSQYALSYKTGGFRHYVQSIHNNQPTGNGIFFWLNTSNTAAGSSAPNTGNILGLALNSGNVGIGTTSPTSKLHVYLNPANNYTTETVKFGNIHFGNGTGDYSNIWIGSIATPLTLSASNYTLANDGTNTIINGGSGGLFFHVGAAAHWNIQSTGHLLCASDNSRDIGAVNSQRPRNIYVGSDVISRPSASITPANNGQLVVEATSNTTLTFKLKGTDGTVRAGTITLA